MAVEATSKTTRYIQHELASTIVTEDMLCYAPTLNERKQVRRKLNFADGNKAGLNCEACDCACDCDCGGCYP